MKPTMLADGFDNTPKTGIDKKTNNQDAPINSNELDNEQPKKPTITDSSEFNKANIRSFLNTMGLKTQWEQSFVCPCVNPMTISPDPMCAICHGTGRAYLPAKKDVPIAIVGNNKGKRSTEYGTFDEGEARGTVQADYRVSAWDRITVPDAFVRQQYMFNATEQRVKDGMYIPYDVREIIFAVAMKPNDPTSYREVNPVNDYKFDKESNKMYISNDLEGFNISLIINATLRYIVSNVLKELRYQYTKTNNAENPVFDELPRLVSLRREEAFVNNIPLINPSTSDLTKKADEKSPFLDSARNTDAGFGF